jgi:putative transposase
MKRKRSTEERIALHQAEAGTPIEEVYQKWRVSEPSFYRWKKRLAGMGVSRIRRPAA